MLLFTANLLTTRFVVHLEYAREYEGFTELCDWKNMKRSISCPDLSINAKKTARAVSFRLPTELPSILSRQLFIVHFGKPIEFYVIKCRWTFILVFHWGLMTYFPLLMTHKIRIISVHFGLPIDKTVINSNLRVKNDPQWSCNFHFEWLIQYESS